MEKEYIVTVDGKPAGRVVGRERLGEIAPLVAEESEVFVVYDANAAEVAAEVIEAVPGVRGSIALETSEEDKSMDTVLLIVRSLLEAGASRKALVLAVGGGITTDLAGFAASIYKRGVRYANYPTTLLSQVDAGVGGKTGHGVAEEFNLYGRIDIHTGTLGKSFGGAVGGFTTGRQEIIDMLRQRSRPYLFSNSLPPMICGAGIELFKMLEESDELHTKQQENVKYFREKMLAAGFDCKPTQSAILAVMLYDAPLSQKFAARMAEEGIFVTGFYYPVVPKGQARIRVQISAAHEKQHLDKAIAAFIKVGKELGVLK